MNRFLLLLTLFSLSSCSEHRPTRERIDSTIYNKAFDFKDNEILDSAFSYFSQAKDGFLEEKDSLGVAKCYVNMGVISTQSGDYFGAQEASLSAIQYFNLEDDKQHLYINANYNNLGLATQYLTSYNRAIGFYMKSLSYASSIDARCVIKNNIANVYRIKKNYKKAISIYTPLLKQTKNKIEFARILSNLAFTKWLANPSYNPLQKLHEALNIRRAEKDLWGQNASYSHLADYYLTKKPDSALYYAREMYIVAKQINSAADKMQALQKLIQLAPPYEVKSSFMQYSKLDDSVKMAHNIAKNQFAVIRYETEKHKADFSKSQTENAKKQSSIFFQWVIVATLTIGIVSIIFSFKKRNKLLRQTKDLELKDTELKFVKRIHDRVANKVYQVMAEVENIPELTKEDILDKLEVIYGISRDISYEKMETASDELFATQFRSMLLSYASEATEILIMGNNDSYWIDATDVIKMELYCVLQEFMTNMAKHSQATAVEISFKKENNSIKINYKDNGVGINNALQCKNGLTNTGNRIDAIRGTITFDTKAATGLMIDISVPVL